MGMSRNHVALSVAPAVIRQPTRCRTRILSLFSVVYFATSTN